MKRKEANAFEEQLLKEKMDELHKKLHQVAEPPQESLPTFQESPEVCVLDTFGFLSVCTFLCPVFRVNSSVKCAFTCFFIYVFIYFCFY